MSIRIKICGLTSFTDANCAAQAGADYLGFIFFARSPRAVDAATVRSIIAQLRAAGHATPGVGVFVNEDPARVRAILHETGLTYAQLHGDEPVESLQTLAPSAYKALRPARPAPTGRSDTDPALGIALQLAAHYHTQTAQDGPRLMVDAYDPAAYGGTGKLADQDLAHTLASSYSHLLLAGGLTPDNVAQAITQVEPWGVDVASGVERAPGQKDHAAIEAFVYAARSAADSR